MTLTIELESPLRPEDVLSRLNTLRSGLGTAYQCPPPLDRAGATVRVHGHKFYLVGGILWGKRTSYRPAWRGTVEPGSVERGGSRLRVVAGPSLGTIVSWSLFLAWVVVVLSLAISHGIPVAGALIFFGGGLVAAVLVNGANMDRAAREREVLLGVLRQIVEAPAVSGPGIEA